MPGSDGKKHDVTYYIDRDGVILIKWEETISAQIIPELIPSGNFKY